MGNRFVNPNESAFAIPATDSYDKEGLTKREYFASMAMQCFAENFSPNYAVSRAVELADLLIEELNKQQGK